MTTVRINRRGDYCAGGFSAMASPCELLLDSTDTTLCRRLTTLAADEALRIEARFSRFRDDNIIHQINTSNGSPINVDEETARLLDYAQQCWQLSDGRFDVTAGILRRVWRFDGSDQLPDPSAVAALLPLIGWDKVDWHSPVLRLPAGMEIDLGGIGKEYAVDRIAGLLARETTLSFVINLGGDLYVRAPRGDGGLWAIGIDDPAHTGDTSVGTLRISQGGVATSGDARRYLQKDGIRYGHILDPRSGWPVADAPHGVTVLANTCTEAGTLSTLAMLRGAGARDFLKAQGVRFWLY